jgi:flagellar protein FlbD
VILVTRLNGSPFAVNPDLLERVEPTPDTVLTLIDGTKYLVTESVTEVIALVRDFRASVVVAARAAASEQDAEADEPTADDALPPARPHLHVAPEPAQMPHRGA